MSTDNPLLATAEKIANEDLIRNSCIMAALVRNLFRERTDLRKALVAIRDADEELDCLEAVQMHAGKALNNPITVVPHHLQ